MCTCKAFTPVSLSFKGQETKHTTVKWSISCETRSPLKSSKSEFFLEITIQDSSGLKLSYLWYDLVVKVILAGLC